MTALPFLDSGPGLTNATRFPRTETRSRPNTSALSRAKSYDKPESLKRSVNEQRSTLAMTATSPELWGIENEICTL